MQSYDIGVASIFEMLNKNAKDIAFNDVGVLKDILKLDYMTLHTSIILLQYKWIKRQDACSNLIYIQGKVEFLCINFYHKEPKM